MVTRIEWIVISILVAAAVPGPISSPAVAMAADLAVPEHGITRSGAFVSGWEVTIDHDVYYLESFTSPFGQPWEPQHEVEFAHGQGSAMFMYLEVPRSIGSIARGDHDAEIAAWFERWCEVAWVDRDIVAPLAEMNGDWTVWSAIGRATTYQKAYRRIQSLALCHVRWAYAPSDFAGWASYFPGDGAGRIAFVAPSVFAWSCRRDAASVVQAAAKMGERFGLPTIIAQTGTPCRTGRAEWYADLFAGAAEAGVFAVIPGHFPRGGQPLQPWDNPGFVWALQYTENDPGGGTKWEAYEQAAVAVAAEILRLLRSPLTRSIVSTGLAPRVLHASFA